MIPHAVPDTGRDSAPVLLGGGGVLPRLSTTTSQPLPETGRELPILDFRRRDAGGEGVGRNRKRNVTSSSSSSPDFIVLAESQFFVNYCFPMASGPFPVL